MRSTHIVQQLLFSLLPSILTFDFDLILGSFLTFWGLNGLFLSSMWDSKTVLGSTHVVEQLSFCMILSFLNLPKLSRVKKVFKSKLNSY